MKDSVMKFAALAMMVIVFVSVGITDRWIDNSDEVSAETNSSQLSQPSRVGTEAETWHTGSEAEHSAVGAPRADNTPVQQEKYNRSLAQRRTEWRARRKEEQDDGGEPPDERQDKDIWRSYVIE